MAASEAVASGTCGGFTLPVGEATHDDMDASVVGTPRDFLGVSSAIGDLNNDGYADLAVGSPQSDLGATNGGAVFVFFGPLGAGSLDPANADATLRRHDTVCSFYIDV